MGSTESENQGVFSDNIDPEIADLMGIDEEGDQGKAPDFSDLIGEQKDPGAGFLFLIAVAMSLHFIGTDHEFRRFDPVFYDRVMRWSLAGSLVIGWIMGISHILSHTSLSAWLAFLSGAIIINTMWEEVPDERSGRFWPFLFGAVGFAGLVLVIYKFR